MTQYLKISLTERAKVLEALRNSVSLPCSKEIVRNHSAAIALLQSLQPAAQVAAPEAGIVHPVPVSGEGVQGSAGAVVVDSSTLVGQTVPGDGWQPIATVPKDWGITPFDVWSHGERVADAWWGFPTDGERKPGVVHMAGYDCNGPVDEYVPDATHWRPLPKPPVSPSADNEVRGEIA